MSTKMQITGDWFSDLAEELDELTGNIKPAVNECLTETHKVITMNAEKAIKPHYLSGDTERSLMRNEKVQWDGNIASMNVGFNINKGGLPSVFLMYGTPRMSKDQKLFNAFRGAKTKKEIQELQEKIMRRYLDMAKKG
ncbi:hypothetical protein MKC54_10985 [[Clostridium] innocuum]|nr:hypothetical protein [[Clostridium] innocuum]MCR0577410.1 hypothetical protein [[Clostridium] innocuum]